MIASIFQNILFTSVKFPQKEFFKEYTHKINLIVSKSFSYLTEQAQLSYDKIYNHITLWKSHLFKNGAYGRIVSPDVERIGIFVKGQLHGEGIKIFPNGFIMQGTFDHDEIFTGIGRKRGNHCTFWGTFFEGQLHGEGAINYVDGTEVKGIFNNGILHSGTILFQGTTFEGTFQNYQLHGEGLVVGVNGTEYRGTFENGNFLNGTKKCLRGHISHGLFKKGELYTGTGRIKWLGKISEGEFLNGELHGKGRITTKKGKKIEKDGTFENGRLVQGFRDSYHGKETGFFDERGLLVTGTRINKIAKGFHKVEIGVFEFGNLIKGKIISNFNKELSKDYKWDQSFQVGEFKKSQQGDELNGQGFKFDDEYFAYGEFKNGYLCGKGIKAESDGVVKKGFFDPYSFGENEEEKSSNSDNEKLSFEKESDNEKLSFEKELDKLMDYKERWKMMFSALV